MRNKISLAAVQLLIYTDGPGVHLRSVSDGDAVGCGC